jgi:crooked neck
MPRKVKKRRKLDDDSYEEYMDYVFPADDTHAANFASLLQKAHAWKKAQEGGGGGGATAP